MTEKRAKEIIENMPSHVGEPGLEAVRALLDILGNPQKGMKIIHVAGTNGKGSVCACVSQILMEAGFKVGLFTSPYLVRFNERIQINRVPISDEMLADAVGEAYEALQRCEGKTKENMSQFRFITAVAFLYFKKMQVDAAVMETGLGGRYDATNVSEPVITAITAIGYDHMEILGETIEKIAFDKAGIIKSGVDTVIYPQPYPEAAGVLLRECEKMNSVPHDLGRGVIRIKSSGTDGQCFDYESGGRKFQDMKISLPGEYQVYNACTAIETAASLPGFDITEEHIRKGLQNAAWQGRFEIVSREPAVILDGAHNPDGMDAFVRAYKQLFDKKAVLLLGFTTGHDHEKIIERLKEIALKVVLTSPSGGRAATPEKAAALFPANMSVTVIPEPKEAYRAALDMAKCGVPLAVTGSLYLVGDIKRYIFP